MHYYQFNIGDYIKQTVHLTPMEDICYRRLLDMYYETEQPIPIETDRVSRRLRLDTELVNSVLNEFFILTENGWINARCEAEISAYHVKAKTARSNGKLGGRPKKTQPVSDRNPEATQDKANQEPLTINQEPLLKPLRRKSAPMPSGFKLNEVSQAYAQDRKLNVSEELVAFANWHTAKGSTFKDWQAAWRTWCDKAVEFGRSKGGAPPNRDAARQAAANSIFRDENIQHLMGVRKNESSIDAKFSRID